MGLNIRTQYEILGVTLGYARRVYVFDLSTTSLRPGWHLLRIDLPSSYAAFEYHEVFGADIELARGSINTTLGYRGKALLARTEKESSLYRELSFFPTQLDATKLRTCRRMEECTSMGTASKY